MKISQYNLIIRQDFYTYWYNTLYRKFFRLKSGLSDKIESFLLKGEFEEIPKAVFDKLVKDNFIVNDDVNELDIIRARNTAAINSKDYFLIILPTLNCNYHCWYCIQDHIQSRMDDSVLEKIKRHIDYMLDVEHITSLHIDWFGGEPLMYFEEVIQPISRYALMRCKEKDIPFRNGATTNGYYLSETVIKECIDLGFRQYQITLDGDMESHDKVKFQKGCESTFKHVLNNINRLLSCSKEVVVYLRINYTKKNLTKKIVDEVNSQIREHNRSKIIIIPRKVWQEDLDREFHHEVMRILDMFRESGYGVEYWDPVTNYIPCYANKKYYSAINCNGNVVKCTACNDLYERKPKGILLEDGLIKWSEEFDQKYMERSYENERCRECKKLPICMGLCPREHLKGETYCKEEVLGATFEDSIVNFMQKIYENSK